MGVLYSAFNVSNIFKVLTNVLVQNWQFSNVLTEFGMQRFQNQRDYITTFVLTFICGSYTSIYFRILFHPIIFLSYPITVKKFEIDRNVKIYPM